MRCVRSALQEGGDPTTRDAHGDATRCFLRPWVVAGWRGSINLHTAQQPFASRTFNDYSFDLQLIKLRDK